MHAPAPRKMLSTPEAALYLGLGKSTMDKLRLTGEGAPYLKLGNRVVYDPDDLDAWASARKHTSTSEYLTEARAA